MSASAQTVRDVASSQAHPAIWPHSASPSVLSDPESEGFIAALLARMTIEEKVGQTIQADIASIRAEDLLRYPLGSVLAGGSSGPGGDDRASATAWVDLIRGFREAAQQRPGAQVPLMFGIDAVHGNNNVPGATIFPHNIGLGAARDPDLIHRIGTATAQEVAAVGAEWTFGPTLAVPRNDRWGRTYEGYSENPEVQRSYAAQMTQGLQGSLEAGRPVDPYHIAGSAKHFLADGGTTDGRDQGDAEMSEQELIDIHLSGYTQAIDAGILTIMPSFSSWNGVKVTGNRSLLTDVLRGPLGFKGFTIGDWNAHGQLPGCSNTSCALAFNSGLDMFMAPDSWRGLYDNTLAQVRSGEIPMQRLDEAVTRILRVKVKLGLFDAKRHEIAGRLDLLNTNEHRALAREAVRKSIVLLKNEGSVLPIRPGARVLVAGPAADDIGRASGGWTISWQGTGNKNTDFPLGQSVFGGIEESVREIGGRANLSGDGSFSEKPDVAIVVFSEQPYAETLGDVRNLEYRPEEPLAILRRLKAAGIPTVSVFLSGRPLWVNPELNASDAFVAGWLPGSQAGAVGEVLVAGRDGKPRNDFVGRLSFSWPRTAVGEPLNIGQPNYDPLFAYGYGLTYRTPGHVGALSEESGVAPVIVNLDRLFTGGGAQAPWTLTFRDMAGVTELGTEALTTPQGVVYAKVDSSAQEDGFSLTLPQGGMVQIAGDASDFSPVAERALTFRLRLDAAPAASMMVGMGFSLLDLQPLLPGVGEWKTLSIPLSCLTAAGVDLSSVDHPFTLMTMGPARLSLADIVIAAPAPGAVCPPVARMGL
ncbi:MAG: glycoside hydrolase family 3 N-terminal domain-containing protein [Candidatus Brevundimonas colombiensis]|uniref:Glycoside hydrolase family 3 N-terminal domain-containing protein n=1 Tax=Candidatus Brevundimonas colombiensis TaxID=3121376 RepID=A0AAJ5X1Y2_9CAUL|nr:glycoside hydrolase family 3 protein [Brevundimonas sp.]WEK41544.1 MAG: glycoside hydrolase family 3 N-terminal domain-containing protein [Brevundimonas sp.]